MKLSLNWIRDFITVPKAFTGRKLAGMLTLHTAEVEDVQEPFENIIVGKIKAVRAHPNADKMKLCDTDIGEKIVQIVCGGKNTAPGMLVAVALPGAIVDWHGEGKTMEIRETKIRGEESHGMICAGEEIGLPPCPDEQITDLETIKKSLTARPGTSLAEALDIDDVIFDIDNKSLTHRPDLWSHYGFARELSAILDIPLEPLEPAVHMPEKGDSPDIEVREPDLCPRYCGLAIESVTIEESPDWLKKRLEAIGQRPINNIVDVTNYVMAELGNPLHAFDDAYIKKGIIVRRAKKGEKITTLDGEKHTLTDDMLVIADHEKPVAIAGIMGAENSEIREKTKKIIIEAANFNPVNIRRTSLALGLRTESVQRFEKSLDPELAELAVRRATELILKICPKAKISGPLADIKNYTIVQPKIAVDWNRVQKKIGKELDEQEARKHLSALGFQIDETFNVTVPSWRATKDVDIEDDIVEEIARMHGYDKVPDILPELPAKPPTEYRQRTLKHKTRAILSLGLGFTEIISYSFYGQEELAKCGMREDGHLKLKNYLSSDQTHLRTTLSPNILKRIQENLPNSNRFKIYEIGHSYKETGEYFPLEQNGLTAMIVAPQSSGEPFYEAKGAMEEFLRRFDAPRWEIKEIEKPPPYAHPAKTTGVFINGEMLGLIFEIHPVTAKNHEFDKYGVSVGTFWLNFTKLVAAGQEIRKYRPIPKFPDIRFDVSVAVGERVPVATLEQCIRASGPPVTKVELFDIFRGEGLEKGKKACAFHVTLQADDRTLTDDDMAATQKKVFQNLQKAGGTVRGLTI